MAALSDEDEVNSAVIRRIIGKCVSIEDESVKGSSPKDGPSHLLKILPRTFSAGHGPGMVPLRFDAESNIQ